MTTPRWYMVNKMGMATLCTDKEGAEQEAADAQRLWPHMGPHRAVQLVEVADVEALRTGYAAARPAGAQQPGVATWTPLPGTLPEPGKPVLLDIGMEYPIRAMWAAKHALEVGMEDDSGFGEYDEATDTYYCPEGWYEWNEHEETHWAVDETPTAWCELPPNGGASHGQAPAQAAPAAVGHDEDLLEKLYWEFDSQRKKTGEERLAFKVKMRFYASEFLRRSDGKMTFAQSVSDDMMNLADRLGSEFDDVDPRAWKHLLVYAPKEAPAAVAIPTFEDFCKRHGLDPEKMNAHGGMWARVALDECRATTQPAPQADSVTAPAATVIKKGADRQWMSERLGHLPDGIYSLYLASSTQVAPTQVADSVLEDAARLDWLLLRISGAEFRRIGVHYSGNASRADVDAARKQGENHD